MRRYRGRSVVGQLARRRSTASRRLDTAGQEAANYPWWVDLAGAGGWLLRREG